MRLFDEQQLPVAELNYLHHMSRIIPRNKPAVKLVQVISSGWQVEIVDGRPKDT